MKITIDEIAEMAGVSKTTVSRVLNNKPDVKPETREQIHSLIAKYDFKPNAMAKAISLKKSHTICLIIPHEANNFFSNPFFTDVLHGISVEVDRSGYFLLLCYPHDQNFLNIFQQKRVDGFILLSPGFQQNDLVKRLKMIDAPFVSTSILESGIEIASVDIDNFNCGKMAVDNLISLGHKKIGFIGKKNQTSSKERLLGYRSALVLSNLPINERYIIEKADTSIRAGYEAMEELIKFTDQPTAIVSVSDLLAIGVIQRIHESRKRVPGDYSIIGFDDIPLAEYFNPPLTTIQQPSFEKGVQTARLLIQFLEYNIPPKSKVLDVKLIIRGTTAPLNVNPN
jgi:LacI family transcriptional regulator